MPSSCAPRRRRPWGRRTAATALALAGLVVTPRESIADEQDGRARSRDAFSKGVSALNEGRARDALALFQQAYALFPHYATEYNIALCERALGHFASADEALHRFLDGGGAAIPPRERAAATRLVAEVEARTGFLTVRVTPVGAKVKLDARALEATGEVRVDAGDHAIEAEAAGFAPARREARVTPGSHVVVEIAMVEATAAVDAKSAPGTSPGDDLVDGSDRTHRTGSEAAAGSAGLPVPFWIGTAAAGAGLAVAGVCGAIALSDRAAYRDPATADDEAERRRSHGVTFRTIGDVALGVAVVGMVTAVVVLVTHRDPTTRATARGAPR